MSERESIFARIREALTVSAPFPGHGVHGASRPPSLPTVESHRRVLPAVGEAFEEQVNLFQKNSLELRSDFKLVKDFSELAAELRRLRDAEGWERVATHSGRLTDLACQSLGLPLLRVESGFDKTELEKCPVGITECDALVAQTGSVLVTSASAGGRALSVLPPHHVVLAERSQLVAGLPDAFGLLKAKYAAGYPSMISFVTGPSRTGDIERILVLGAHGPKKLTILCV